MDPKLTKETYIERIEIEQKNRKVPGVCTYHLEKSMKEKDKEILELKKKKQSVGDKRFFHQETSFISNGSPGAGTYNPHDRIKKIRKNKTYFKEWIAKHKS